MIDQIRTARHKGKAVDVYSYEFDSPVSLGKAEIVYVESFDIEHNKYWCLVRFGKYKTAFHLINATELIKHEVGQL